MIASEERAQVQQIPHHEDVDGKALPAVQWVLPKLGIEFSKRSLQAPPPSSLSRVCLSCHWINKQEPCDDAQ
jgi:hypothetical protein